MTRLVFSICPAVCLLVVPEVSFAELAQIVYDEFIESHSSAVNDGTLLEQVEAALPDVPEFHAGRGFEGRANVVDQLPRAALGIVGPVEADGKGFVGIEETVWVSAQREVVVRAAVADRTVVHIDGEVAVLRGRME